MLSAHPSSLNFSESRQQIYSRRHFQYRWLLLVTKKLPSPANITWATTTQNMWYVSTLFYNLSQKCPAKKCVRKSTVKFQNGVKNRCDPAKKKVKMWPKDCVPAPSALRYLIFFGWNRILADKEKYLLCDMYACVTSTFASSSSNSEMLSLCAN